MGYETYYIISRVEGNEDDYKKIVKELEEISEIDLKNGEVSKWYDSHEDCLEVSKKYPDVMFQLNGDGEDSIDVWATRYKGGESETVESVMPPFKTLLSEEEKAKNAKENSGITIYYVDPDSSSRIDFSEIDMFALDRKSIDEFLKKGIGTLMPLEEFICKFNTEEISDLGYITRY